jgi:DNA-directed RNA polymerase subunit K/omega
VAAASPDNPVVGKAARSLAKEERSPVKVAPNRDNPVKVAPNRDNPVKVAPNRDNPVKVALRIPSPAFPVARHPRPALPAPVVVAYPSNPLAWQLLRREPAVLGLLHNIDLLPPKTQPARPNWRNGDTACAAPHRGPLP